MLRLTGGEFRGRLIETPRNLKTRPTQARLRQALFNSIQAEIPDSRVLELFAGSGALGFEALSRGAAEVVFVENDRTALKLLEKNAATLRVESRVRIVSESVDRCLPRIQKNAPFDLVLADPPYAEGWEKKLLEAFPWKELLKPGGTFLLEWGLLKSSDYREGELPEETPFLVKIREKLYSESVLTTYQMKEEAQL